MNGSQRSQEMNQKVERNQKISGISAAAVEDVLIDFLIDPFNEIDPFD